MEELGGREDRSLVMFNGVLRKVMEYPLLRSICKAKAKKGMIWPCAMNGNITMFSLEFFSSAIVVTFGQSR